MIGIEVVDPGLFTTVQDWPGRVGYWHVGVPPSGPMDDLSFRIGNRAPLTSLALDESLQLLLAHGDPLR